MSCQTVTSDYSPTLNIRRVQPLSGNGKCLILSSWQRCYLILYRESYAYSQNSKIDFHLQKRNWFMLFTQYFLLKSDDDRTVPLCKCQVHTFIAHLLNISAHLSHFTNMLPLFISAIYSPTSVGLFIKPK